MNRKIDIADWQVCGFWPYVPLLGNSVETGMNLLGVTDWIPAGVPGSIYKDLLNAGIIEDPYFERNSLNCEWVANRWWAYKSVFCLGNAPKNKRYRLIMSGIDYKAAIYLNGKKIGAHEGMYHPFEKDVTRLVLPGSENILIAVIENAPEEMGQIGHTNQTLTQKSRFNYKWDFSTRLVNLGLYGAVWIEEYDALRITEKHIKTFKNTDGSWSVSAFLGIKGTKSAACRISAALFSPEGETASEGEEYFEPRKEDLQVNISLNIENPELWWPNGYGPQPLYKLVLTLFSGDEICKSIEQNIGFRTLEYRQADNSPKDALPYNIEINGKRIYIKGLNMVPLDHLYGCVTKDMYRRMLSLFKDANATLIRVWGGGIIESEDFYDLCDEYGLLVWQEFIQSSSGINNTPSEKPHFLKLLKKTAVEAVKTKRNHVSLTFWSGGNELMEEDGIPCGFENKNIKMLHDVVRKYNPKVLLLPTSASGPLEFLDTNRKGLNHDVHGPWKYSGTTEHYRLFNNSDSILHSELGCDGMGNLSTIKTVLSEENQKVTDIRRNLTWRHHGEWWDTLERDTEIFGTFEADHLETYIKCSQFIQAEAIRYAVEANRRRMWQNCGSIIWVVNEPWPNVSGNYIIDYYQKPKLAYYLLKEAYRPFTASLYYEGLVFEKGGLFKGRAFIINDNEESAYTLKITAESGGSVLYQDERKGVAPCNSSNCVKDFQFNIDAKTSGGFKIILTLSASGRKTAVSRYLFFIKHEETGKADRSLAADFFDGYMLK